MKNLTIQFLALLILFSATSTILFAQDTGGDPRVWSIVKMDPTAPPWVKEQSNWVPAEPITRYFGIADATVGPNYRVKPGNTTQSELSIDVHPTNSNIVFGSSNSTNWPVSTLYGTGVYWSLDGGTNWTGFDNPPFGSNSGDPVSVIGVDGRFYENYINNSYGQSVATSTNNGTNWTNYTVAPNPGQVADKNHYMVDKTPTSPYVNRSYCAWTDFGGATDGEVVLRYSTNFGQTWSSSINVSGTLTPLSSAFAQGNNIQTGPNGELYVIYAIYDANWTDGEDAIGFSKSTNGGTTWTHLRAYDHVNFGIRGNLSSKNGIRVSSFPSMAVDRSGGPRNGWIYITWAQRGVAPAGSDPDIVMIRSNDGGATWTSPVRVNDDALNNGKDQYYSWCTVDQVTGQLMLIFYDSRDVPNNQAEVYMASSLDGGNTFTNFKVSDQPHTPTPINGLAGGYAGDYIGIAALDDIAYPFWADNRLGSDHYQAWTASVTFGPPCPIDPASNPSPANGAIDLPISGNTLNWTNGIGATQIEVWFDGSMVYSGNLITSFSLASVEPLNYLTDYSWRIIGKNDTCNVSGPTWSFKTMQDPNLANLFCDDFTAGLGNWTITNDGGAASCVWSIYQASEYTLPPTAVGNVMSADADACNGTSGNSRTTAVHTGINASQYQTVWLEFDNDWQPIGTADFAYVDVSVDGGVTWQNVFTWNDVDVRSTHEVWDLTSLVALSNFSIRFKTIQPAWDWWWAVDNICIYATDMIPVELTSFAAIADNGVIELSWITATETNNRGFEVQRSNGNAYETIAFVAGHGTTTEPQAYSYSDRSVNDGSYSYRLKQIDFNGTFEYSIVIEVDITIPLEYSLDQNYPNPFNPSTTIKYSIPEDGFVKLAVYNMLGEEVTAIVNTTQKAGRYEVNFNASKLSSGVYVYRIEAANFTASKKLMLMK